MITIGSVVKSKCGRDKERFFVVLKIEGDFLFLADGKVHKLLNPKKKRASHVSATRSIITTETKTDKQLRNALSPFYENENGERI